jgi:tRNA threonylcarbamoyladenosine biosynthesis protein TsaE
MPVLDRNSLEVISRSAEQTRRIGMRLGGILEPGDLICMVGELGSGKTTLVQGITAGWGSLDATTSPTFVLVNVYRRPQASRLFHMDAYRLNSSAEAEDLDIDAMLDSGPLLVEWADRIFLALPDEYLTIHLQWMDEMQRDMIFSAKGSRYNLILNSLRSQLFGGHV